ncbi:MAG: CRISPR system precrRNA processing endoribonuclease RAMP protein Cas6 [Desulfobacterium sp.]|nr:CRISPR system precrRNA processing endoribonuclease RAMP protein Cas6 [Desulfobacterium sp.]
MGEYHFICNLTSDALLPAYKGSTFRGIFGHALKRVVCTLKTKECPDCLLKGRCLYAKVFADGNSASEQLVGAPSIPRPYVIKPPKNLLSHMKKGDAFDFHLLLFGEANQELPYFVYAFTEIGSLGIGKRIEGKRAGFVVNEIRHDGGTIYTDHENTLKGAAWGSPISLNGREDTDQAASRIKLSLETPLRLKFENHLHANLPFHILIRALLRRISSLFNHYGDGEPPLDYKGLVQRANNVTISKSNLHWFDWKRYSNRQDKSMLMGGMLGSAVYEGELSEFIPIIRLGELLHIGKQTTFGLGEIHMEILQ